MAISIKNEETYRLAKELSGLTGESITESVTIAIKERLGRLIAKKGGSTHRISRLEEVALHCSSLPRLDQRTDDEIMGYDNNGMPE